MDKIFYGGDKVFGHGPHLGGADMAILTLPVVIVATEEALSNVSPDVRLASAALGCHKFQTVSRVVLPQAVPGILTGAILAISRGAARLPPSSSLALLTSYPPCPIPCMINSCSSDTTCMCSPRSRRRGRHAPAPLRDRVGVAGTHLRAHASAILVRSRMRRHLSRAHG